ncbi:MAG: hypothetical protein KatS3mg109_0420 [Pirellulaceae bacterium]|nr:MAG: hypothetical protein KatS3mg109_0420 [Pirellulaceae bacterium]
METAAAMAGVSKQWLYETLRRGARDAAAGKHTAEAEFADAVKKADAKAEAMAIARITEAGRTQWQALAWRLERRYPERWGRRNADTIPLNDFIRAARLLADAAADCLPDPEQREAFLRRITELVRVQIGADGGGAAPRLLDAGDDASV